MILKRIFLTLLVMAGAAAAVWFYLSSGPKHLNSADVISVIPDRARAALFVRNVNDLNQQLDQQPAYLQLYPKLTWLEIFAHQKLDSAQFRVSEISLFELNDTTWMTFGMPEIWNESEQKRWLVDHLKWRPTTDQQFSLENGLYATLSHDHVYLSEFPALPPNLASAETGFYGKQFLRSGDCDISEVRHLDGTAIPLLGTKRSSYVVRDFRLSNQFLLCEEIVEDATAELEFGPLPEQWKNVLPVDMTAFEAVGSSSGFKLIEEYRKDLDQQGELAHYNSQIAELENSVGKSAEQLFEDWWSDGLARFQSNGETFLLLGCVDASLARNALSGLPGASTTELAGGNMIELSESALLDHLFQGYVSNSIRAIWVLDERVILAPSTAALIRLASLVRTGQTIDHEHLVAQALSRRERFIRYAQIEDQSSSLLAGATIPVFPNSKSDPTHYLHSGSPSLDDRLVTRIEVSAAAKPVSDIELEWQAQVKGIRPLTINSIKNHQNGEYYMVVQDENNVVHAIDARGKTMWKYPCEAPLIGDFQAVDLYKNGKFQIAFTTSSALHCLDLRGRKVPGFPVKPGKKITAPLFVADYDNNRNYRFLVGIEDGTLLNYRDEGISTPGWKHKRTADAIVSARHIKAGNKDYIFVAHKGGAVELLKRNGESRYDTRLKLPSFKGEAQFRMTSSIASSTVVVLTDNGNVVEASFGNGHEPETNVMDAASAFALVDIDGDRLQDLIVATGNKVKVYTSSNALIYERDMKSKVLEELRLYTFSDGRKLGVILPDRSEIHLLENDGSTSTGYPLFGAGPFVIRDLDADGKMELISTDGKALLVCYQL